MKEHKTLSNRFEWVPPDKRRSRFGGGPVPPRKPETRVPILWLTRDGNELYLVNLSKEALDSVVVDSGGYLTADDDVVTVGSEAQYHYKDVKPNDAVKVDEYDGYYDLDYVLQVYLTIKSPSLGCIEISSPPEKGGVGETVLLWDSGESGKYVSIRKCQKA
jgi:hypothetical protein